MPKKKKIVAPLRYPKAQEIAYKKRLMSLGRAMTKAVREQLLPYLKENQERYVMDGLSSDLGVIYRRLNAQFTGVSTFGFAQVTAEQMMLRLERSNKKKFDNTIKLSTGVDIEGIIRLEGLQDFIDLNIQQNVSLIKSLPEEYFKQIEVIVNKGVTSGARYGTIANQITAMKGSANSKLAKRIRTIARDQISTINAQMGLRRTEALGIKKGIFRTSKDERVRNSHKELDGDEYVLAKGAWSKKEQRFIQPGITDINCRCSYSPIIEV